jgi:PadR family transcriptional regulator PadR
MKAWVTQLRKGLLEFCVLNVLAAGESYGYRIVERLRRIESLRITESTVYPILARLTKEGYLRERVAPSPAGPPRRYLSLTDDGRARVEAMNDYWRALRPSIDSLLESNDDDE